MISAEQMNENFQALVNSNLLQSTSVNCDEGETINGAIESGYNDITVSGTCNENLNFVDWDDSPQLAPKYLKLVGADSTAKILDASDGADSTIFVGAGTTLSVENMTISGGKYAVGAYRNSNLLLSGVAIEGFNQRGIDIGGSSFLGIGSKGVTIIGKAEAEFGICFTQASASWIHTVNISNVQTGINLYNQSYASIINFFINAELRGISIHESSTFVRSRTGAGVIEGTSEKAINASPGNFYSWGEGTLTIQNLRGGGGIHFDASRGYIANLKMPDFDTTGTGWNPAIQINYGSALKLEGAQISGSTDEKLIVISEGSNMEMRGSSIKDISAGNGIDVGGNSRLYFRDSNINGTINDGILVDLRYGSSAHIQDSSLNLSSGEYGLRIANNSSLEFWNSTLSGKSTEGLMAIDRVSSAVIRSGSSINQMSAESPDVLVRDLSLLTVWADGETSIGNVNCWNKSSVSADEGTVADLDPSCIEDGTDFPAPGSLDDLQGTWKTACQADGTSFSSQSLEVSETNATVTVNIYPDSNCTTVVAQFTSSISNMTVSDSMNLNDGSVGYKVNYIQGSLTLTPLNTEMSDQFNVYGYCGITSWANGVSIEINGRTCDSIAQPLKNTTFLNTYKLIGTNLFLGDGSTLEYPPTVDSDPFVKQ